ncbi:DUF3592 domain-containing protein [Neptuniibacter sp. QD48_55]|uniref:DUF3592 domain-containing protein n=1 Tax=Neptuniibacter sp. QD48_55 TaxID=3398212 RepID=UPI0039F5266C
MKAISIIKYLFSLIGLGLLILAFVLFTNTKSFLETAVTAEGTVIELRASRSSDSLTYHPVVSFVTNEGQQVTFSSSAGSNPPSYSQGEVVEVLYQANSPQDAKINGFFTLWGGATIVAGLGAVFFIVGILILIFSGMKGRKRDYLKTQGVPIKAQIHTLDRNTCMETDGVSPFVISLQWHNPEDNKIYLFRSDDIWFDPTEYVMTDELTVYIDRNNPAKYHVDLSFLPQVA